MVLGIVKILGLVIFLYLTWRNLKDSYEDNLLISYSWLAILSLFVGGRIVFGLTNWGIWNDSIWQWLQFWQNPGFSYYGGIGAIVLMTFVYCNVNNWKVWSFLEDMTPAYYLLMAFMLAEDLTRNALSIKILVYFLIVVVGYLLSYWIAKKYRSFVWYKSGKKGFVFLFVNFVVGILLAAAGIVFKEGVIWIVVNLIISLISAAELFILGEVFKS